MRTVGRMGPSLDATSVCARSRGTPEAARARYRSVNAFLDIQERTIVTPWYMARLSLIAAWCAFCSSSTRTRATLQVAKRGTEMIRKILWTGVLIGCTTMAAIGARGATFVLTSGERVSGELTYKGGTDFTLNGRDYPSTQVAIIAFQPGDPTSTELSQLPDTDNPADEHNRHMFVLTNGQVIHGKLYHISADGETIQFDPLGGNSVADRRSVPASQIARIYITPTSARSIYHNVLNAPAP